MATYKKRGNKKSIKSKSAQSIKNNSSTAEVFETLDVTASKTETIVARYQNHILFFMGLVVLISLTYLAYEKFIGEPKSIEAASELNRAQYYFDIALNTDNSDSLYLRALNGGDGRYGFLDIIENYDGTPAAKLATYSAGMSYLNMKDYKNAIKYLDEFDSNDVMLGALSKGAIGDAFANLGQNEEAYDYYVEAFKISNNNYTTPKYLYKASIIGSEIGYISSSIEFLNRIKSEYPDSYEAEMVDLQIGRIENINK